MRNSIRCSSTLFALALFACLPLFPAAAQEAAAWAAGPRFTADTELARIAEAIPGFGGLYYNEEGYPNIYLTDTSRAPEFLTLGDPFQVHVGQYDFRHLLQWRAELRSVLSLPDVVFLDVDERTNRIRIGVDLAAKAANRESLEGVLARSGIPREAVIVSATEPIIPLATLRDRVRPVPGGVQIAFSSYLCTLGFNAKRSGVEGFVTNSHCTATQGGVQNTVMYQNTNSSSNRIGIETVDPGYWSGSPCPSGRVCRYSDSAFARYDSTSTDQFARIARTTSSGSSSGSITISSTPRFTITGTANFPSSGQTLNKMGRTTGWTRGTVSSTCVDVNVSGTNITQLCQDIVNAGSGGGDSGSPVFSASTSSSNTNATLYGILWGGDTAGTIFVMSAWSNITFELGSLTVR